MRTYTEAVERLGARQSRKLQNNTYVQRRSDDTIAVRLHATDVVTYYADGRTVLGSNKKQTNKPFSTRLTVGAVLCATLRTGTVYTGAPSAVTC
jgi:hypothetical protein